ncbi:hypothetical protein D3C83_228080 [compost metagenome]
MALVRLVEVEDGEEGFAGGTFAPVGGVAGLVPCLARLDDVVVFFDVVGGVVTGIAQVLGIESNARG